MTKQEFLTALRKKLSSLSAKEIQDSINFYDEIINDKIEEGKTEEVAVSEIGSIDDIATQILAEKQPVSTTRNAHSIGNTLLLILSSPIWISLLISAFAIVISLYASIWAVVISLWACFIAFTVSCPCGIILGIFFNFSGNPFVTIAIIGASITVGGLAILTFFASKKLTAVAIVITKKLLVFIKNCFTKKEAK